MTRPYSETPGLSGTLSIANVLSVQAAPNLAKPSPKPTQQQRPLSKAYAPRPRIHGEPKWTLTHIPDTLQESSQGPPLNDFPPTQDPSTITHTKIPPQIDSP